MKSTKVAIIGGSQAGLCMSYSLRELGVPHLVLERSRPGVRWRTERWHSLRLLSPNWQVALPGYAPRPHDPDGFMTAAAFATELETYAERIQAPLETGVSVHRVTPSADGPARFHLETNRGDVRAESIVVATGQCALPSVPAEAAGLGPGFRQIHSRDYKNPARLPPGGVLVVGASATGVQLACELAAAGRKVVLAAGPHTRMLRRYRGRDIMHWLELSGIYHDPVTERRRRFDAHRAPSMQLLGSSSGRDIGLESLVRRGVEITGSVARLSGDRVQFEEDLPDQVLDSEERLWRVLDRIDAHIEEQGVLAPPPFRPSAPRLPRARLGLRLTEAGISTVLWATGYRADLSFLDVGVRVIRGEVEHDGGVCSVPGVYLIGMNFMRHRSSSTIAGTARDAGVLASIVARDLRKESSHAA